MDYDVRIGSRKWNALQAILDERKDCTDRIDLREAITFDARIYKHGLPFFYDPLTGDCFVPLDKIVSAIRNYADITDDEVLSA